MAKLLDLSVYGPGHISNILQVDASVYAKAFVTDGGKDTQVVRGDGTLASISSLYVGNAATATNAPWSGITGKPTTFTPSAHTHTASDVTGLPTKLSAFTNDVGFITGITKSMVEGVLTGNITSHTHSYLPLSGGTLTGPIIIKKAITDEHWGAMTIKYNGSWSAHTNYIAGINVEDSAGIIGRFGVTYDGSYGKFIVRGLYNSAYDKSGEVFSVNAVGDVTATKFIGSLSGNAATATNADKLDGYHKDEILRRTTNPASVTNLNDVVTAGIDFTSWSYSGSANINNQPNGDGAASAASVVSFGVEYPFQIYSDYNNTSYLYYRSYYSGTGWKNWRRFAFIDSNVASATKLQTPRTIWGQSFDGSGNVSGEAIIGQVLIGRNGNVIDGWYGNNALDLFLNFNSTKNVIACYNGGNVIIGNATSAGYKLQVNGSANATTLYENGTRVALSGHTHPYLPLSGGTMTGAITMNTGTGLSMKYTASSTTGDRWIYPTGADSYGIRYFEGDPDKMTISATGNNTTIAGADLCINGNGSGTVTIRGNTIYHTGNLTKVSQLTNDAGYKTTDTNTWRPVTNTYTGSDQSICVSQYGTNALYNSIPGMAFGTSVRYIGTSEDLNNYDVSKSGTYSSHDNKTYTNGPGYQNFGLIVGRLNTAYTYQLALPYSTNSLKYRSTCYSGSGIVWLNWRTIIDSDNISSYALTSLPSHTHTKSQITDFPSSMPASDVYAWAKASTKPTYTYSEVGAAAASHTHSYLPLSGGTLTGMVTMKKSSASGDAMYWIETTNSNHYLGFGEGTSGNRGIYDKNLGWVFKIDTSNNVTISGNASTATSATKLQDNTAFTAWGQTFFENGKPKNVSGNLYLSGYKLVWLGNENYSIYMQNNGQAYYKAYFGHQFFTYGVERLTIASGGNILIGTTTDNGYKLQVNGSANATTLYENGTRVSLAGHTHDDRYYTESEVTNLLAGKANSSHGTHLSGSAALYSNSSQGSNCNDVTYNLIGYYTSNGPSTSLGASTNDGTLYSQAYSSSWVSQIAQDYRNGNLFTRGKNNGTWTAWKAVSYNGHTHKYAGSSSAGGAATSVVVTDSNANSTYRMVWHSGNSLYSTNNIYCNPSTDSIYASAFYETSDERLKDFENSVNVDLNLIRSIPKMYFRWKKNPSELQIGTSAQAVKQIYPELVSSSEDGILSVDYSKLSIVALSAIDKLHLENQDLKREINILKQEIEKLKGQI